MALDVCAVLYFNIHLLLKKNLSITFYDILQFNISVPAILRLSGLQRELEITSRPILKSFYKVELALNLKKVIVFCFVLGFFGKL